ncbi:MAG TPA: hypothetical protein VGO93_10525 [Candidatus Xenobia bacterium]
MKRFASRLAMLAVLVGALLALCNAAAIRYTPPTVFSQKLSLIEQQDLSGVQVAIFGTSRPYHGVDPAALPWPAYNFCDLGQPLDLSYAVFHRQLPRMPHLGVLILGVDEFTFGIDDANLPSAEDYLDHGYDVPHATWMTRLRARIPLLRFRRNLLPQLLAATLGKDFYDRTVVDDADRPGHPDHPCLMARTGFFYTPTHAGDVSDALGERRAVDRRIGYNAALRAANRNLLATLLSEAVSHHIRVVLLRTPVHAAYRRHEDAALEHDFADDVASVMQRFSPNDVKLLSYWKRDFPDIEYNDVDHLNGAGAQHLARLLAEDAQWAFADKALTSN